MEYKMKKVILAVMLVGSALNVANAMHYENYDALKQAMNAEMPKNPLTKEFWMPFGQLPHPAHDEESRFQAWLSETKEGMSNGLRMCAQLRIADAFCIFGNHESDTSEVWEMVRASAYLKYIGK